MTPAEAGALRRRIAARWPEADELTVDATGYGAQVTMMLDGGYQCLRVTPGGVLMMFLLSRPVKAAIVEAG